MFRVIQDGLKLFLSLKRNRLYGIANTFGVVPLLNEIIFNKKDFFFLSEELWLTESILITIKDSIPNIIYYPLEN